MTLVWESAGATDVGRMRDGNEDSFRMDAARGIFLVADGMGGHAAGEIASRLVADVVVQAMTAAIGGGANGASLDRALGAAVERAHEAIADCCGGNPETRGMGTTLTAVVIEATGAVHVAHIGDSRLYLIGRRGAAQLTRDHTWVQAEIDAGRIPAAVARNHPLSHILTHVLTDDAEPVIDRFSHAVEPGDILLLATDGLYNMLEDTRIAELATADIPLEQRVGRLIEDANRAGGSDNITVIIIGIGGQASAPQADSRG